jgi:hypothetical protein
MLAEAGQSKAIYGKKLVTFCPVIPDTRRSKSCTFDLGGGATKVSGMGNSYEEGGAGKCSSTLGKPVGKPSSKEAGRRDARSPTAAIACAAAWP